MGEISIDQKFNIHTTYKKVRILNPYRFNPEILMPTEGLQAYYKLNTEATDNVVIDSHSTINGVNHGATINAVGKIGKAYSFDGANSWLELGTASDLQIPIGSFSIWFKTNDATEKRGLLVKILSYSLQIRDGMLAYYSWGAPTGWKYSGVNVTDNTWKHAVFNWNNTTKVGKIYLNGALIFTGGFGISSLDQPTRVGTEAGTSAYKFNGVIDEIAIYNKEQTEEEVLELYNNGNGITL